MVQFDYSAYDKKSTATTVDRKGLREGYVHDRWFEDKGVSRLPWLVKQQNKSLEPTAEAAAQFHRSTERNFLAYLIREFSFVIFPSVDFHYRNRNRGLTLPLSP